MKKRNNKIIVLVTSLIIFIVALLIFILNYSKDEYSFSILEKKWLSDNKNNIVDVSVYNDIAVFGRSGNGVIFDYLDNFTKEYEVEFNKVSYMASSSKNNYKDLAFKVLKSNKKTSKNDIVLYEDIYVVVSDKKDKINKIEDLENKIIGVLSDDLTLASYYLSDAENLAYKSFKEYDKMLEEYLKEDTDSEEAKIDYLLLPYSKYLESILEKDLNIIYHVKDIKNKYVLNVKDNKTLLNIMKKYTYKYMENNFDEAYKTNYVETIFNKKNISSEDKMNYNANPYTYGYVTNVPYEVKEDDFFGGTISNYLSGFENTFDVEIKTVRYNTINDLKKAFSNGEVDILFGHFNTSSVNVDRINTNSLFEEKYVILSSSKEYLNSVRSLKDKEVYTISNTYLYDYLKDNGVIVKGYENSDELVRNIDDNLIVAMNYDTYCFYKNNKLSTFNVNYIDDLDKEYNFVIRDVNKNKTISTLFNIFVSSKNYNEFKYEYNISDRYLSSSIWNIVKYIAITGASIIVIFLFISIIQKKKKKDKVIKKEEKMKFIDTMTSLKNRNYLNFNIEKWDENVIYPQSFIVIDLNNIKEVNDTHGHEEGDNVIKKAASILIINQLENTDIMRTDGNEFLIYLVGYGEKEIVSYTRKLTKELKELPYGFGASIGYSMITDDVKTVDDAINEATIEMRKVKEKGN